MARGTPNGSLGAGRRRLLCGVRPVRKLADSDGAKPPPPFESSKSHLVCPAPPILILSLGNGYSCYR